MHYAIETKGLGKQYNNRWAVRDVSLHIPVGKIYGLLGRNGAGKTTLMKICLGLTRKTAGSVFLFDQEMTGPHNEIYSCIGSTIEAPGFYPNMTSTENLAVFARLRGKINYGRIRSALDVVGLPYQDKKTFSHYSLGMKQRLAIACAIMNDPSLLILDEPTNGLDPIGIMEMRELIHRLSRDGGKTVLISSHQLSEIEQSVDWIGSMHEGSLLEECSYQQLKQNESSFILLKTEQPEQVCRYLFHSLHMDHFTLEEDTIRIFDSVYSTLEINSRLFSAGFGVSEITMCRSSLEDHFKELTGGVGIA